jgi:predicted amino acid dehydrogenase
MAGGLATHGGPVVVDGANDHRVSIARKVKGPSEQVIAVLAHQLLLEVEGHLRRGRQRAAEQC